MQAPTFSVTEKPPFKNETADERLLFETIGRMSVHFAPIEASLDLSCTIGFHYLGGKDLEKVIPRGFQKKIQFLEKLLPKIAPDRFSRDTAQSILDDFGRAALRRNEIMHSIVTAVERDLQAKALLAVRGRETLTFESRVFSIPEIEEFTRHLYHLAGTADRLFVIAVTAMGLEQGVSGPQQPPDNHGQTPPNQRENG